MGENIEKEIISSKVKPNIPEFILSTQNSENKLKKYVTIILNKSNSLFSKNYVKMEATDPIHI